MTNNEAKEIIKNIYEGQIKDEFKIEIKDDVYTKIDEAFKMSFKALEQLASNDCVSRQAVRDIFPKWKFISHETFLSASAEIDNLSPVTPTRKVGEWIYTPTKRFVDETDEGAIYETQMKCNCSVCGADFGYRKVEDNYCKFCGADMRGN